MTNNMRVLYLVMNAAFCNMGKGFNYRDQLIVNGYGELAEKRFIGLFFKEKRYLK